MRKNLPLLSRILNVSGVILGLGLIVVFGFALYSLFPSRSPAQSVPSGAQPTLPTTTLLDTSTWLTYTSTQNHFTVKYPPSWSVRESPDNTTVFFSPPEEKYDKEIVTARIMLRAFLQKRDAPDVELLDQIIYQGVSDLSSIAKIHEQIGSLSAWRVTGIPLRYPELTYFVVLDDLVIMVSGGPYPPSDPQSTWQNVDVDPSPVQLRSIVQNMVSSLTAP